MPELIPSKSLPQAEFIVSMPLGLLSTMSLICAAPHFEGLDPWLTEKRRDLPPPYLDEMSRILGFPGHFQRFTEEICAAVLADNPQQSYPTFLEKLRALPDGAYIEMAQRALGKGVDPPLPLPAVQQLLSNPSALAEHLRQIELKIEPAEALEALQDLNGLKARFIAVVERFWKEVYSAEWTATLPMMERSTAHHRRQRYRLKFPDLFVAVTGRLLPESQAERSPERVRFVPCCYIGPYFSAMRHADAALTVFYNCRVTPMGRHPGRGPGLFPLLKALADETRLQIVEMLREHELYAQQIVNRLGISQAAVSRHLKLMERAGVLRVRREGGAKYYSINATALAYLADALRELGEPR